MRLMEIAESERLHACVRFQPFNRGMLSDSLLALRDVSLVADLPDHAGIAGHGSDIFETCLGGGRKTGDADGGAWQRLRFELDDELTDKRILRARRTRRLGSHNDTSA